MSLVPKVKICVSSKCDKIDVYEETGIYNPNNLTGWGTPNIDTDDIKLSNVKIYDSAGNDLLQTIIFKDNPITIDVYTPVVGSPTPGNFLAKKDVEFTLSDGIFQIDYFVQTFGSCVVYDYEKDYSESTGDLVTLYYKNCDGVEKTFVFTDFPYIFSFCGTVGQTSTDIYTTEMKGETVINDFQGDVVEFNNTVTETVEDCGGDIYESSCYFLNICSLENCLNNLKSKIVGECNPDKIASLKNSIDQLEIIIYGIKSAFSCKDFDKAKTLIEAGTVICENICDSGC